MPRPIVKLNKKYDFLQHLIGHPNYNGSVASSDLYCLQKYGQEPKSSNIPFVKQAF